MLVGHGALFEVGITLREQYNILFILSTITLPRDLDTISSKFFVLKHKVEHTIFLFK